MRILLTGTTQGIGKVLEDRLSIKHQIITVNRREYRSSNNIICDLSDLEQVELLCQKIKKLKIDALINNAGGSTPISFEELSTHDITKRMNLNFVAPVMIMQAVIPYMKKQGSGRIINISSTTAKTPVPYIHIYGAAKAALDNIVKSTALYYAETGILINSILPGAVRTDTANENRQILSKLHGDEKESYQNTLESATGLGRMVEPEEIADIVEFLLSEKSRCIYGQTINTCGIMEVH